MQTFKDNVNKFFKWVKGTELVELDHIDTSEDPVRPELDVEWRTSYGRKIYGLKYEDKIEGIICIAYTNDIPHSVKELDLMSQNANLQDNVNTVVAYTVWSRKRGAGKEIIEKLREFVKTNNQIKTLVTLSPLTPMATHFHIRNGAKLKDINTTTQNFEYEL
jgi:hypothetical protein|tara:strand:- start:7 stop:492 length:486 start_codon:yes stop_codon:yes gene_type:complete